MVYNVKTAHKIQYIRTILALELFPQILTAVSLSLVSRVCVSVFFNTKLFAMCGGRVCVYKIRLQHFVQFSLMRWLVNSCEIAPL
jgi:hypothetical protein